MAVLSVPRSLEQTVQYRYLTLSLYLCGAKKDQPPGYLQYHQLDMLPPPTKNTAASILELSFHFKVR